MNIHASGRQVSQGLAFCVKERLCDFALWMALICSSAAVHAEAIEATTLNGEVYAILKRACFECQGPERQDGGLRLDSRERVLQGGDSEPTIRFARGLAISRRVPRALFTCT